MYVLLYTESKANLIGLPVIRGGRLVVEGERAGEEDGAGGGGQG